VLSFDFCLRSAPPPPPAAFGCGGLDPRARSWLVELRALPLLSALLARLPLPLRALGDTLTTRCVVKLPPLPRAVTRGRCGRARRLLALHRRPAALAPVFLGPVGSCAPVAQVAELGPHLFQRFGPNGQGEVGLFALSFSF